MIRATHEQIDDYQKTLPKILKFKEGFTDAQIDTIIKPLIDDIRFALLDLEKANARYTVAQVKLMALVELCLDPDREVPTPTMDDAEGQGRR